MTALSPFRFRLTLTGVFFVVMALTIVLLRVVAHAAGDPSVAVSAAGDATWDIAAKDGPIWAALLLVAGLLRTFLSKQHWLAQGKLLSGITGVMLVLGAVLAWHFADAPASGILTALFAAYTLITHSTVPGAAAPAAGPPTSTSSGSAAMLAVLLLGAVALPQTGCAASTRESTIHAAMVTVDASKEAYVTYDAHAQDEIVSKATSLEGGRTQLTEYRSRRSKVVKAFVVAYQAIATAAQLNDDRSLASVMAAVSDVIATVRALTGGAS